MDIRLLNKIPQTKTGISTFYGYNHNMRIGNGEFYDMKNMTSDNFPALSPRGRRGEFVYPYQEDSYNVSGIIAKDDICFVDGNTLYIGNRRVTDFELNDSPKQMVSMGAYLVIFPDKKYVNTKDFTDKGAIEAKFVSDGTVKYEMCRADGRTYEKVTASDTEPKNPANMDVWLDTSTEPTSLRQYSTSQGEWASIATTYVKISAKNIAKDFNVYDGVTITGITSTVNDLQALEGQTSLIWDASHSDDGEDDYIVVVGILDKPTNQQNAPLTVERRMPILDFVIESQNRLWGCRYGKDINGETVNEIYASKLGDFKNWNSFMGTSTDSYVVSCGTDGQWTGAINYGGQPVFFKENCLHKVYGSYPSAYQVQDMDCRGVQLGCANSLAIVREALYYKSRSGVCMYDGSLPIEISQALGDTHYTLTDEHYEDTLRNGAVAGTVNNKYYISMRSERDKMWHLFAYDAEKNMWHKEDNTRALQFCTYMGELYYIDYEDKSIRTILGSGIIQNKAVEWEVETGALGMESAEKKYISRLIVRLALDLGARVSFWAQYDSVGDWKHLCTTPIGKDMQSFSIPIKPQRCDHFKLKIKGIGDARILSMVKVMEQGSDK